eukprot:3180878-Pyramimonas_sp.AAC.1
MPSGWKEPRPPKGLSSLSRRMLETPDLPTLGLQLARATSFPRTPGPRAMHLMTQIAHRSSLSNPEGTKMPNDSLATARTAGNKT